MTMMIFHSALCEEHHRTAPSLPQPPVATSFSISIPESNTTAIDVAARCAFSGSKASLVIQVMSQPSGGDSVGAPDGNNDLPYTAGTVTANVQRSFTYRVSDTNGTSATATCSVTVINTSQADAYGAIVQGISGSPSGLIAYWRLGDDSAASLADSSGNGHSGTYPTSPAAFGVASLTTAGSDDKAVNFGGVGQGSVPHDAAFLLSAFSLSFKFKLASLPALSAHLVCKDQSGLIEGDFSVGVMPDGRLRVYFQTSVGTQELLSDLGTVITGVTHHVCVRADSTGFDAYLNGTFLGSNSNFTGALASNTQPIRFAKSPVSAQFADAIIDEVPLYNIRITEADVFDLAETAGGEVPIAVADSASALASGPQIVINVTANDTFIGNKADLTFGFNLTGTAGTAIAKNANGDLTYTPPATPQSDSFGYRIIDANGTSNFASVMVNVVASGSDAFSETITGISNLVAYWRLGDTSTALLLDSSGNGRNGTYPETPTAFSAAGLTWQASDSKAVNFGGAGYGQVAHHASFATARGTLCGYFKVNSLAAARTFVNKGTSFVLQALTTGALQLTVGSTTIASVAGIIETGVEYHIAVMWDQVAIWLVLDGRVVVWSRLHTAGLTSNSSAWQFARTTAGANSTVQADEIALYSRRLDLGRARRGQRVHPRPALQSDA